MILLPFSNEQESSENSRAENDGSESADDAQGAGTHSLSVEGGLIIGGDFCEKQHTVCSARRGWLSASSTRNTFASCPTLNNKTLKISCFIWKLIK